MRKEPEGGSREQVKMAWKKAQEAGAQELNHKKGAITTAEHEEKIRLADTTVLEAAGYAN